ncbi:MAG: MBL fold metallo-hydrolase [Proteobacteria bacterium]|nr:MBL fold metallo-hydrolase [Pseudomonadota bacterium]
MHRVPWRLALAGITLSASAFAADGFGPASVRPAAHPFRLGALKLTVVRSAQVVLPNDGKVFGVDSGPGAVSDLLRSAGAPTDRLTLSVDALLVRTGARLVLIDSGFSADNHGNVTGSLAEVAVSPKAITDVLITHSHGDHTGGLLDANHHLVYPKATIRMAKAEWAAYQKSAPAELIKAIASHVKTFEPGATIAPGITSVALDGHTAGHVGYEISSKGARLLDIGDMAHSSIVSLAKPDWTMGFDKDPAIAKQTRQTTLQRLAHDQELVFSPHFPYPGLGHIVTAGNGFAWKAGGPEEQ